MSLKLKVTFFVFCVYIFVSFSCTQNPQQVFFNKNEQKKLLALLDDKNISQENRYAVINQISNNYLNNEMQNELVLFLTRYVEKNPQDIYNPYWLLMTASIYLDAGAEPIAEYYFDKIIQNYDDLLVKGQSVHILCLQHLIQISTSPENRINYFSKLISSYPEQVNTTELYVRLAVEYEKLGDWEQALKAYIHFLEQPDASIIQISGMPDAYLNARKTIDFSNSSQDWTFETLEGLESAVKTAISRYNYVALDKYKSKVNFFAMSWRQEETDANSQESFSMRSFMRGNRIRYSTTLDEFSNPNEAYLRTTGWSTYIPVWYLYFRKINFPANPDVHGHWEWAGIYYGEKL